jgi:hypothetical protein
MNRFRFALTTLGFLMVLSIIILPAALGGRPDRTAGMGAQAGATQGTFASMSDVNSVSFYFSNVTTSTNTSSAFYIANISPTAPAYGTIYWYSPCGSLAGSKQIPPIDPNSSAPYVYDSVDSVGTGFSGSVVVNTNGNAVVEHLWGWGKGTGGSCTTGLTTTGTTHVFPYSNATYGSSYSDEAAIQVTNPGTETATGIASRYYWRVDEVNATSFSCPGSHGSIWSYGGDMAGGDKKPYSTVVTTDKPVTAFLEQTTYQPGSSIPGFVVPGLQTASTTWYDSGIRPVSGQTFSRQYAVINAGDATANVVADFCDPNSANLNYHKAVNPHSVWSFMVDEIGLPSNYSGCATFTSDKPVFAGSLLTWQAGKSYMNHDIHWAGHTNHAFAYGQNGDLIKTFFKVQNIGNDPADVTIDYHPTQGSPVSHTLTVAPKSFRTVDSSTFVPNKTFSTLISSTKPVNVTRDVFWNNNLSGHSAPSYGYSVLTLNVDPTSLSVIALVSGLGSTVFQAPKPQSVSLSFSPATNLPWTAATSDLTWLKVSPTSGSGAQTITITVDPSSLARRNSPYYTVDGTITITAPGAQGSPKTVPVRLFIFER